MLFYVEKGVTPGVWTVFQCRQNKITSGFGTIRNENLCLDSLVLLSENKSKIFWNISTSLNFNTDKATWLEAFWSVRDSHQYYKLVLLRETKKWSFRLWHLIYFPIAKKAAWIRALQQYRRSPVDFPLLLNEIRNKTWARYTFNTDNTTDLMFWPDKGRSLVHILLYFPRENREVHSEFGQLIYFSRSHHFSYKIE